MSPEVPETVKEPLLAIETLQGHEGADPWRAGECTRARLASFSNSLRKSREPSERGGKKSRSEIAVVAFHITTAGKFSHR